jgi:hypothetical protein
MKIRILCASLSVLFCGLLAHPALAASPSDYPVKIHVVSSELKSECSSETKGSDCGLHQLLTVTIDAKKYKLETTRVRPLLLLPGDYHARVTKEKKKGSSEYFREYEVLYPDGKTMKYIVVGEFD